MTDRVDTFRHIMSLLKKGRELSSNDAEELERQLAESPENLELRAILVGFYEREWRRHADERQQMSPGEKLGSPPLPSGYCNHALYFVEHVPESDFIPLCARIFHNELNPAACDDARRIWLTHIDERQDCPAILRNAAHHFFMLSDPPIAEDLLLRGKKLEPNNPEWPEALSLFYSLGRYRDPAGAKSRSVKALSELEEAMALRGEQARSGQLGEAARFALDSGDTQKAKAYANAAVNAVADSDRSLALHYGHTVLGRLVLQNGDLPTASDHLIASGDVDPYPTLSSFGPNMMLAKELLEAGERDAVLKYFENCARFWNCGFSRLDQWAEEVRANRMPDFGPNLTY